jgi:putative endopeptidase
MTLAPLARVLLLLAAADIVSASIQKPSLGSGLDQGSFDAAVRPQDDLYGHANGGWLATAAIPEDRSAENASSQLFDRVERDVRGIIERLAKENNRRQGSPSQQVVDFYASMVNEAVIDARGISPLAPELQAIEAIASSRDLAERAGVLSATTIAGPFFSRLTTHPQNPDERIVQLSQGGLLLERDEYLKEDDRSRAVRANYEKYLEQIFTLVGRPAAAADAAAVLALEITLAKAHAVPGPDAPIRSQLVAVTKMTSAIPGFDWIEWARPQGMDRSMTVLVLQPTFFRTFGAMVSTVPFSTWRAWLAARYITAMAPSVIEALGNARFEFFGRFLAGQQAPRPRWKRGVSTVNVSRRHGRPLVRAGTLFSCRTEPGRTHRRASDSIVPGRGLCLRLAHVEREGRSPEHDREARGARGLSRCLEGLSRPDYRSRRPLWQRVARAEIRQ